MVGVITRVEQRAKCVHYFVEDLSSRGGITCIAWKKKKRLRKFDNGSQEDTDGESEDVAPGQDVDMHTFHLNDLVKINGKLSVYRNDRQLTIHKMIKIEEENEESLWHLRILQQEKRT